MVEHNDLLREECEKSIRTIAEKAEHWTRLSLPDDYPICEKKGPRGGRYLNKAVTFDIETTSYSKGPLMSCWMYWWTCHFLGRVYYGRNWEEFEAFLTKIANHFKPVIVPIYVHNLPFEFSFMRHVFEFIDVFAVRPLTPIRAKWKNIEFRDSLVLSGLPLEKLPTLTKKLKGALDYSKVRTERTPLTYQEIAYCVNDVEVLAEYINSKIVSDRVRKSGEDNMATIPMTRTGYVRRDVRHRMGPKMAGIQALKLSMKEYRELEEVFCGGFTHAAAHTSNLVLHHIRSLDITSSYPTVMIAEEYPISEFWDIRPSGYEHALGKYWTHLQVEVHNIRVRECSPDCILSESKCDKISSDAIINNGRVVEASYVRFRCTGTDYKWFRRFYETFDTNESKGGFHIITMRAARKGHLPKPIIEALLYYYSNKTKYKGVKGAVLVDGAEVDAESFYGLMKELLNACYGMAATKPLKELISLIGGDWITLSEFQRRWRRDKNDPKLREYLEKLGAESEADFAFPKRVIDRYFDELLKKYNDSRGRFLYYAWAAATTSYARQNLFEMMWKCGEDYHYSDTDSLKISNWLLHKKSFDRYNRRIVRKIRDVLIKMKIDPALATPKDPNGIVRPLGIYTDEGEYLDFKTLGAKRYMTTSIDPKTGEEVLSVTVAGAPKKQITEYMKSQKNPFAAFTDNLVVPKEVSGKLMATHITKEWEGFVTDYLGRDNYVFACGGTHLAPMDVTLKMSDDYLMYLIACQAADYEPFIDIGLI